MNLTRGDALLRFRDERKAEKPLRQREMSVVEDRTASRRELLFAGFLKALKQLAALLLLAGRFDARYAVTSANKAPNTIRPAHRFKVGKAIVVCGELLMNFYQVHRIITLTQTE